MKIFLFFSFIILAVACNNPVEDVVVTSFDEELEVEKEFDTNDTFSVHQDAISINYPSDYILDGSWRVYSDIQEGFFLSYTIQYENGKDTTVSVDESSPAIGRVDHPESYYVDSLTYVVPNVGGCNRGYYSLYIYKNGTHQFVENITVIDNLKKTAGLFNQPNNKNTESFIEHTYWASIYHTVFNSYHQEFNSPTTSSLKTSFALSFYIASKIDSFELKDEELKSLNFVYSENSGLGWEEGKGLTGGKVKGNLLPNNTWEIEVDAFIELENELNDEKIERHIKYSQIYKKSGNSL